MTTTSFSVYPNNLDGYATLPLRQDGVHEIKADDVNRLRDAIIKIEQELGTQPSGTYATVTDRLDDIGDIQAVINAHIADTSDAHDASSISVLDSLELFYGEDVESVLEELGLMLEHKPDNIGEDLSWIPNSGIPSFYSSGGTKFVYNTSDWSGEPTDNPMLRTQTRRISGISGIHVLEISSATVNGTGLLTYNPVGTSLTWQAPGDSSGTAVDVSGLSTGETAVIQSSNTSFAIRVARNSDSLPALSRVDQFEVYGLDAVTGTFAIKDDDFVESSYITRASTSSTGVSRNQLMISGMVHPAHIGTLVLQRKRRNDSDFYPIAVLDLSANFDDDFRTTSQPVYVPTMSNFDVITLYDRFPALRDYSENIDVDGNQIYEDFFYTYNYNAQVAKYLIPLSNSDISGGELGSPDDTTSNEIDLSVSTYRLVHYKSGVTGFTGEPSASDIYSTADVYGNSSDGDSTVRFSNLYVDPNSDRPGVEIINITPPNPVLDNDLYKYLSGIKYYRTSESLKNYFLFRIQSNDNFASNAFLEDGVLRLTTNVFEIPSGLESDGYSRFGSDIDIGAVFDDAYQPYASHNTPDFDSKAWYLVANLYDEGTDSWNDYNYHIDRALQIPDDAFSTRARLTATFYDPFGPGDGYDGYGDSENVIFKSNSFDSGSRDRILVNSYSDRATDTREYFTDESYRIGEGETFLFPTVEDKFTYSDGFHIYIATNKIEYSEDFSAWSALDAGDTIIIDATEAPNGLVTADDLIADATDGEHGYSTSTNVTLTAVDHILSVWAKKGDKDWLYLSNDTVTNATCYFDLNNGVLGTKGAGASYAVIEDGVNDWYRCSIQFLGTVATHTIKVQSAEADGDKEFFGDGSTVNTSLWGAMCQTGNILEEWNSSMPIGESSLQCGGLWTPGEIDICGLIYPQNNYMSGSIMPFQFDEAIEVSGVLEASGGYTVTDYFAPGSYGLAANYDGYGEGEKFYQRLFSLGYPICNARLRIVSDGYNPVSWSDIAYFNTDRFGKVEVKIPGDDGYNDTGWLDIGRFYDGSTEDGSGAASGASTGTAGDFTVPFTFGTRNNANSGNMVAVRVTYFSHNDYATDVISDSKSRVITMLELLSPISSE